MEIAVNLVLDMGNTRSKVAVFEGNQLKGQWVFDPTNLNQLDELLETYQPTASIMSSVGEPHDSIKTRLKQHTCFFELTHQLPLPFTNLYQSPETLGMDRIAGVAGALHFFKSTNCLVIDMGTCVTYDFMGADKKYWGGAIAPGLNMRLIAMSQFTKRLPLVPFEMPESFIGNTTQSAMLSGVYYGLLGEINQMIERYDEQFGSIKVMICGGDAPLFDKHTKKSIFAAPDLVLYGLNKLLQYNAT
jgi:type III pantothenate kinase